MTKRIVTASIAAAALAALFSCSERTIEFVRSPPDGAGDPSFTGGDAGSADVVELVAYCPSTRCTNNTATCPGSLFACDVDLMTDDGNCGACGVSCAGAAGIGTFHCQSGQCALTCSESLADCNGVVEDGCETKLHTNTNCGSCGDACSDPDRPCLPRSASTFACGCANGLTYCAPRCIDAMIDDQNCGACGTTCDPTGGGQPELANSYYGCFGGACDRLKCKSGFTDCDDDPETGCETPNTTEENCGGCGIACAPGQRCIQIEGKLTCACKAGETLCGNRCVDLLSDVRNCGACGVDCYGAVGNAEGAGNGIGYCAYGSCSFQCAPGWGDCNGDPGDNCETNLRSDPNNCGGCGITCQANQPCIGGQCAVEPCDEIGRRPQ